MKLILPLLSASMGAATASRLSGAAPPLDLTASVGDGITASSPLGQSLLSQARRLEDGDDAYSYTWIEGYSLKFQGCHHMAQWNDDEDDGGDGDGDNYDVKIKTRRLARFRLCPTGSCSSNAYGCKKGYGDYVVDLSVFAKAYFESKKREQEQKCEMYLWKNCDCDDSDDKGDDFNAEYCEYDCYSAVGKSECIDNNPYNDDDEDDRDELDKYMECDELEIDDGNNRRLEDGDVQYYVGPYCANNGASVLLGLFTDDTCTQYADEDHGKTTYESLVGSALPYASTSVVGMDCISCSEDDDVNRMKENQEFYEQYGYYQDDDDEDEDRINGQCEELYESAGKCEENLEDGVATYPVNSACSYIEGIRITRQNEDGNIIGYQNATNKTATGFIVFFALSFAALGAYAILLRKRLGKTINLDS